MRWYQASIFVWKGASLSKDLWQNFFRGLDESFGPTRLLCFEGRHFDGHFGGTFDILKIFEAPALQLRAIAEVGVFGQRVMLPASSFADDSFRHMPAVPSKLKKTPPRERPPCSSTKWPSSRMASTCVRKL